MSDLTDREALATELRRTFAADSGTTYVESEDRTRGWNAVAKFVLQRIVLAQREAYLQGSTEEGDFQNWHKKLDREQEAGLCPPMPSIPRAKALYALPDAPPLPSEAPSGTPEKIKPMDSAFRFSESTTATMFDKLQEVIASLNELRRRP